MTRDEIIEMVREAGWTGMFNTWNGPSSIKTLIVPATVEQIEAFAKLVADAAAAKEREHYDDLFEQIKGWCEAYPISVFPEPDFGKAHEVLKANGMTLDAISASNMKHVITQVQKMIDAAIRARGET